MDCFFFYCFLKIIQIASDFQIFWNMYVTSLNPWIFDIYHKKKYLLTRLNLVHRNVDVRLLQRGLERTRRLQILDGRTAHLRHGCCRTMAAITTINYSRLHNLHSNDDATRLTDCQSLHRSSLWASKIMIDSIFAKSLPAGFHVSSRSRKTLHTHTNARGHPQHTRTQSLPHVETGRRRLMLLMMLLVTKQKENKRISADVCAPPLWKKEWKKESKIS